MPPWAGRIATETAAIRKMARVSFLGMRTAAIFAYRRRKFDQRA
jgi:hypothetical protein